MGLFDRLKKKPKGTFDIYGEEVVFEFLNNPDPAVLAMLKTEGKPPLPIELGNIGTNFLDRADGTNFTTTIKQYVEMKDKLTDQRNMANAIVDAFAESSPEIDHDWNNIAAKWHHLGCRYLDNNRRAIVGWRKDGIFLETEDDGDNEKDFCYKNAIKCFDKALVVSSGKYDFSWFICREQLKIETSESKERHLEAKIEFVFQNRVWDIKGRTFLAMGNKEAFIECLERMRELDPYNLCGFRKEV